MKYMSPSQWIDQANPEEGDEGLDPGEW